MPLPPQPPDPEKPFSHHHHGGRKNGPCSRLPVNSSIAKQIANHAVDYCPMIGKTRQCLYPQDAKTNMCDVHGQDSMPSAACAVLLDKNCSASKAEAISTGNKTTCERCVFHLRHAVGNVTGAANCTTRQLGEFCNPPRLDGSIELRKCAPVQVRPATKFWAISISSVFARRISWSANGTPKP